MNFSSVFALLVLVEKEFNMFLFICVITFHLYYMQCLDTNIELDR